MQEIFERLRNRISPFILYLLLLLLLWLLFFWRVLTPIEGDQASFKQGDFSGQFVAFGAYQYERLSNGEIPLWNPYNNAGLPFVADTQAAVFYPPRLLTIFLSMQTGGWSYHALELEAIFHVLAYSILMYLFVWRLTGSVLGAFVASIVASYGGFISGYPPLQLALLEAAIWLPLAALGILEASREQNLKWRWLLVAGFALGLSWMAGHPQTSWFSTYLLVAWWVYRAYLQKFGWWKFFLGLGLFGIVTLGVTAVSFLPGIEYLLLASRSNLGFDAKGNGFPFQDLLQFIFPSVVSLFSPLYIGIASLILVFVALRYQFRQSFFWFMTVFVALLHSFGANTVLYYLLYNPLPGLRFFRGQERAAVLLAFALAVLVGIGMSYLLTWSQKEKRQELRFFLNSLVVLVVGISVLILVAWLGNVGDFSQEVSVVSFSALLILLAWGLFQWQMQSPNRYAPLLIIFLIIFDLFSVNIDAPSNYDSMPASEQLSMSPPDLLQAVLDDAPEEPYRVDGFRGLRDNYGSLYQVMDIRGISPLFLQSTYNLVYRDYVNNPRAWEVLAVRYIFSERESFGQVETSVIAEGADVDGHVYVHEILNPRPFAHFVYAYDLVASDEHALELLNDPNFQAREKVILQEVPSLEMPNTPPEDAEVDILEFAPETMRMTISSSENVILSLAMPDYPDWQAELDGVSIEIYRAYGSLMAFEIPAGEHELKLSYEPRSFQIGAWMTAITWLGLGFIALFSLLESMRK